MTLKTDWKSLTDEELLRARKTAHFDLQKAKTDFDKLKCNFVVDGIVKEIRVRLKKSK